MSLFNTNLADAADTVNVQAGGTSFLDDVGNALTYGVGAAAVSGLSSIYNTAAAGASALGADVEQIDVTQKLADVDENWAEYYKQNQNVIDTVGFIGTSFIPGTLAVKGLNALRSGEAVGSFGRALGFARTQQAAALDRALVELAAEGGTVFSRINANKLAAIGWGFADQTLTAAAFETAVALTMKQSPMLADDSWWDIGKSALAGAAFGGVIGGSIDGLILNKSFKTAVQAIDSKHRNYDYLADLGDVKLAVGDKAYAVADSLLALPRDVLPADRVLDLSFHLAAGPTTRKVDISKLLGNTIQDTERKAMLDFQTVLNDLSSDATVSQPMAKYVLEKFTKARDAGAEPAAIREALGDSLFELKAVRAATEKPITSGSDLYYFKKGMTPEELAGIKSPAAWEKAVVSTTPFADGAYNKPYVFTGTAEQRAESFKNVAKIGTGEDNFPTLSAAWTAGKDVAFMPDGTLRVNDSSALWRRVEDPAMKASRYLNTRTGAVTEDAALTAADMLPAGKTLDDVALQADRVVLQTAAGNKTLQMTKFNAAGDTQYFTARHAWAGKLSDDMLPASVDAADFSLMDRLRTATPEVLARITVTSGEKVLGNAGHLSLPSIISSSKLAEAQRLFGAAYEKGATLDVRAVAYQLNVDAQWLEHAVASRFKNPTVPVDGISLPLESYTRRENLIADFARPQQFRELDTLAPDMTWQQRRNAIQESVANSGGQFVTGELAWGQRVRDAVQLNQAAAASVMTPERIRLLPAIDQAAAKTADSTGVGASTFGSANAGYGDGLKLNVQEAGKHTHQWIQEDVNMIVDAFTAPAAAIRGNSKAAAELGVLTNLLRSTDEKYIWNPLNPKQLILREFGEVAAAGDSAALQAAMDSAISAGRRANISVEAQEVVDFLGVHSRLNSDRIGKRTVLNNAKGTVSNIDGNTVYAPPIDTTYFKHFAFVRPVEGKAFGTSEVSMIFGRDAAELSKRLSSVDRQSFDVVTKQETEKFFKAKELYDFDLTINESRINTELKRTGALNNFQPEVRAENLVEDYMRWHQNQAGRLVRDSVETYYAQQFAELRKLGETYSDIATSRFAGSKSTAAVANPYLDYIKTALDVSKQSEYTFLHQANEFVDALGTRAYQGVQRIFGDASKGIVNWQEANAQMERLGIKGVYSNSEDFFAANVPRDRNVVREYISKANAFLANTVLRLDFFNSITNIVSTPILLGTELASIRSLAKTDPALVGKLSELTSVVSPGGVAVPGTTKLIANAVKNYYGPEGETLLVRYAANGDVKGTASQMKSMLDSLALRGDFKVFSANVDKAFEFGAKLTYNEQAEQMTRFISADVMRQLSDPLVEAGKLSLKEQNAYISVFTNRVQGNYVSSQRPIVFQGVLGSAVSLFQTYTFNIMQQLLRHVENKDKRAVATLFGMQAGTFGLNGTPFFEAVNTHIIGNAAINQGHYDAYSLAPSLLGKQMGDWLMYGTASAMPAFFGSTSGPALYTRGDINPRSVTILPLNPADIPAIDVSTRVVKNLVDMGSKLVGGADISQTLLQGLEHNGINRPLAGFAQVLNGKSTTSQGGLISASNDFSLIATASRILGAKPMDEAVALNNQYRLKTYQVSDTDRRNQLGERVKSYLGGDEFPPDEVMDQFMLDYAKAGGRVENFNAALQGWSKEATVSTVEKMRGKLQSSYGQRLNEIMGGTSLDDLTNQASGAVTASQPAVDLTAP